MTELSITSGAVPIQRSSVGESSTPTTVSAAPAIKPKAAVVWMAWESVS